MKKITEAWLRIAEEDLLMAEKAWELKIYRQVCFHAQQGVEKSFKALIIEKTGRIKRVHDLLELLGTLENLAISVPIPVEEIDFLNRVYRLRYPPDFGLLPHGQPEKNDARRALEIAQAIFTWLRKILEA